MQSTTANLSEPAALPDLHSMKIGALLGRIAGECVALSGIVEQLHGFARQMAAQSNSVEVITSLQSLDRLTQYLTAFASIFGDCARSTDEGWTIDIHPTLTTLSLSDLAARLSGREVEDPCDSADLDLF